MVPQYFEDLSIGDTYKLDSHTVTEDEIIDFAEQYDPQDFHIDSQQAEESMFGDLIASGWHTAAVTMRLVVDGLLDEVAVVGAVGVDTLRWERAVYGGDELHPSVTVAEKEGWDDDKGLVKFDVETINQDGDRVMRRTDLVLVEHRL